MYHNLPSGGGKRALFEMTRRLADRHEISIFSLSTADHEFCDLRPYCAGHTVDSFQPLPLARRPFGRINQAIRVLDLARLARLERQMASRIDRGGYDLVFVHNCQFSVAPAILRFSGTPTVYYCQEPPRLAYEPRVERPHNQQSAAKRFAGRLDPLPSLYRAALRHSDRASTLSASVVLVNSYYSRETVYRIYGIFSHVCPLGVDSGHFRPLNARKENRVLSVGALTPNKGFDWIVRALAVIDPVRRPSLQLISNFVDPAEDGYLRRLASESAVSLEIRVGVSEEELVLAYNRAMVTAYTPIMEPFGFVPLESMACGTPIVGVKEAGVRETVRDGETGLLVDRDPAALARAIESLLCDPDHAQELGRNGRLHVVNEWTWDHSVDTLEGFLAQAARGVA